MRVRTPHRLQLVPSKKTQCPVRQGFPTPFSSPSLTSPLHPSRPCFHPCGQPAPNPRSHLPPSSMSAKGTLLLPGIWPEGRPGRGSGASPRHRAPGRASITCQVQSVHTSQFNSGDCCFEVAGIWMAGAEVASPAGPCMRPQRQLLQCSMQSEGRAPSGMCTQPLPSLSTLPGAGPQAMRTPSPYFSSNPPPSSPHLTQPAPHPCLCPTCSALDSMLASMSRQVRTSSRARLAR